MNGPAPYAIAMLSTPLHLTLQAQLLSLSAGKTHDDNESANRSLFASLLAGQACGEGCLPADLGLGAERYAAMLARYFPDLATLPPQQFSPVQFSPVVRVCPEIPEFEDLQKLLLDHSSQQPNNDDAEHWLADIVARACAGADHLWQDLGLSNRDELSRIMRHNFAPLADANVGDMKWKKFLYRQFCALEGIYVCPAPSCSVCADHAKCFGPEQ